MTEIKFDNYRHAPLSFLKVSTEGVDGPQFSEPSLVSEHRANEAKEDTEGGMNMAILAIFTGKGITKSPITRPYAGKWTGCTGGLKGSSSVRRAFDTAGGIRVADVWESQAALDDFFNKR